MTSTIKIKNSSTAGAVPGSGDLVQGELAVNVTDKKIYTKNASGTVVNLGTTPSITDNGNAEAIVIDSSENVGIGTTSPTSKLTVGDNTAPAINLSDASGSLKSQLIYRNSTTGNLELTNISSAALVLGTANTERARIDSSGNLLVAGTTANSWTSNGSVTIGSGSGAMGYNANIGTGTGGLYFMTATSGGGRHAGTVGYDGTSNYMWFETSSTERARIDSSGNLLVGTTSAANASRIVSQYPGNTTLGFTLIDTTSAGGTAVRFYTNTTGFVGSITTSSSATAYNTSSDYRLKENIAPMTGALATVASLKPVTYTWKVDGSTGQGFIAHELQTVVPDCVTGEKDAIDADGNPVYQGIDTSFLVATLTAAIQELKAEFDAYKATHP